MIAFKMPSRREMGMMTAAAVVAIWLSGFGGVVAGEMAPVSEFTTTDAKKVKVLEDSSLEKNPEIDHFKHLCPGLGGYQVIHEGADLRSWINLVYDGKTTDLSGATWSVCPGQFPAKANDVVQWRGFRKGGKFEPFAIIYRMMSNADDEQQTRIETFVVIKLERGESKVVGGVPAVEGIGKAEAMADKQAPAAAPAQGIATVTCKDGNIYLTPAGGEAVRLTDSGRDSDPCLSHDGTHVVFVRDTPGVTVDTGSGGCNATELCLIDVAARKTEVLVKGRADDDMKKVLAAMSAPCFSLDDKTIYFNSAAWAVSNSVQRLEIASKEVRFITDGDSVVVVPKGKHAGSLLISRALIKHDKHGESLGRRSYLWIYAADGKGGKEVNDKEDYSAEDFLKDQGIGP